MYREMLSIAYSFVFSLVLVVSSIQLDKPAVDKNEKQSHFHDPKVSVRLMVPSLENSAAGVDERKSHNSQFVESIAYPFHNPAGCALSAPTDLSPAALLDNVQEQIGDSLNLQGRSIDQIWNGPLGSYVDISDDPFVYEFQVNEFQLPFTYLADQVVAVFVQNGFAVWLRAYDNNFRLTAVSTIPGADLDMWGDYITAYWDKDALPRDSFIVPVTRKLPCRWMIDAGIVEDSQLAGIFNLDW